MFKVDVTYQRLSQYLSEIRELIQDLTDYQWIVAEIAKIDSDKIGHYWIELVEKKDDEVIARCDAVIWKGNTETVSNFFLKTGIQLQKGIKILFLGKATFHEKYGFRLSILQIDPSFTIGEMALKKKEVIERLSCEGLIDKNRALPIPLVIQKIAIISSESAAGYEDFLKILNENRYGFKFYTRLFDAFVQGEFAVSSLIDALRRCVFEIKNFDVVVIIRGGGSTVDLQCFDDYELAKTIAIMPIPVLTGIGHTRDETVADYVACRSFKTPSELAKFMIDKALDYESRVEHLRKMIFHRVESIIKLEEARTQNIKDKLINSVQSSVKRLHIKIDLSLNDLHKKTDIRLKTEDIRLNNLRSKTELRVSEHLTNGKFRLRSCRENLRVKLQNSLMIKNMQISSLTEKLHLLSPENILKRGYSITYLNGKVLKNSKDVAVGQSILIQLYKGKITGKVILKEDESEGAKLF